LFAPHIYGVVPWAHSIYGEPQGCGVGVEESESESEGFST